VHMICMTIVIPGLYLYIKKLTAGDVTTLGWAFAAYPLGTVVAYSFLKNSPLPPMLKLVPAEIDSDKNMPLRSEDDAPGKPFVPKPFTKFTYGFLIVLGIAGNILYAFSPHAACVIGARFLVGIAGGSMVLTHKHIEFSTSGDDPMVRSRMVMLGAVQTFGALLGLLLGILLAAIPEFDLLNHSMSQQQMCGLLCAVLYIIVLFGIWSTFQPICVEAVKHVDVVKGEMDVAPGNYMGFSRFGVLVPAIVYDRGQARPSSLPDVFSTAVVLVVTFFLNNLMTGIEVLHAIYCVDMFEWKVLDISVTYLAFILAGVVGISLTLSLIEEVPCNRRLFGGLVLTFVTYGVMLQPNTPKEQYIGFLVLTGCCYFICDLALVEIYIDKIGEEGDHRMTAHYKKLLMQWMHTTQSYARILGSIVTGYIYSYWTNNHISRRPYAVYGCGFAVALLLVIMCIIFYKRFVLRSQELQPGYVAKEPLGPQQIKCMDE